MKATLHIICTAFKRVMPLQTLINSFIVQTDPNWRLHIIHDGKPPLEMYEVITGYNDSRITFTQTPEVHGAWGHINRNLVLKKLVGKPNDCVLITNDDNYYVPAFIELMLGSALTDVGVVYCDTVHSYFGYNVHKSKLKKNKIDMGAFIVNLPIAKQVGFKDIKKEADGIYAEKCMDVCKTKGLRTVYIEKPLFIHN